jgi:alpha-tubulin suppressor-like RCC1 family protein
VRLGNHRFVLVTALAVMLSSQLAVRLSARNPGQFEGPGWLVAYGGGGSLAGALGVTAAVVSPPVALRSASDAFNDIVDASTSSGHTLIVRRNGSVWSMGANDRGQLGLGSIGDPVESLTQIPALVNIAKVVASGASSYAIDSVGTLWVWGDDSAGQLGIGQPAGAMEQSTPVMHPLPQVIDIDAGPDFAIAADINGAIWSWGANGESQLGAAGPDRNVPGPVTAPPGFLAVDVAAGAATVLARAVTNEVMGWGSNNWLQLADSGATIDAGTTIVSTDVIAMGAGDGHIVLAHADGTVQARGANWAGQLGIGTQMPTPGLVTVAGLSGVVDVSAGAAHSVAVATDGLAYGWGFNHKRQLLLPTPDVFTATPQRVLDVPPTARFVRAKSESTILLSDPGAVAIQTSVPPVVGCTEPFDASIAITGFNASGGEPDQYFPGIQNLEMTLHLAPTFEVAVPVTADVGTVSTVGRVITWSVASLDASRATLSLRLLASGSAGEYALFDSVSYVSSFDSTPAEVRSPMTSHGACAMPDLTPPVISSVTPSITTIAPPNQQMIPVTIAVVATDDTSVPACVVSGVSSNEPVQGDWEITGPLAVLLRAERAGNGNGRVYTVAVRCTDAAGNIASGSTNVFVPKGKQHPSAP